ncbi:ribonuclease H2 subunit C isoform X1 [Diorhabda carinulata]|uniref:ribonuclease H2 subunit C isoform X1 n=1 Tax=Diorhabda carinulata TaxID=1163345 RepID=UPI0025A113A4|nr:ribonuclease H2 subunit C isoform X1 [Diorhabda carinulata]
MATIHINSGKNNLDCNKKTSNVQSLPFKIHADCDAKVERYFNSNISTKKYGTLHASFRGYPLSGKIIDLPDGYVGIVLHESLRPETDKCERKFHVTNKFLKITHWNWDKEPSDNDIITQALQWVDIAEVLHSPIIEE